MKLIYFILLATVLAATSALAADDKKPSDPDKEMEEITKELGSFHSQAEQMMKQLEKASGLAMQNGGQPSSIDVARQKAMRLASDDRFLKSATDLWAHPDRPKMLLIQLGFFLFMMIIKAWRQSKVSHWFKRMLLGFILSVFTWIGIAYVIPAIILGEPFVVFTTTIFRVLAYSGP